MPETVPRRDQRLPRVRTPPLENGGGGRGGLPEGGEGSQELDRPDRTLGGMLREANRAF